MSITKKEYLKKTLEMMGAYNRLNRGTLTNIMLSSIKNFNDAHPEMALTNEQTVSLTKRTAGLIFAKIRNGN